MSPIELFVALVVLAFVGGLRAGGGVSTAWNPLSGVEYVLLGVVIGPRLLGLVSTASLHPFEPLLLMALGWLLAVRGANFASLSGNRLPFEYILLPTLATAFCCALVFVPVQALAMKWGFSSPSLLALGLCVATAETSSILGARDPSIDDWPSPVRSLHRMSMSTELTPVLLLGTMMLFSHEAVLTDLPGVALVILSVFLGLLSGGIVVALIGAHFEQAELWPLLLGAVLLVVGTALRLDLPALTPCFLLGLSIALLSQHRREIRDLMNATDRQLLLPCLLLAGAMFEWPQSLAHWLLVLISVFARAAAKLIVGMLVALATRSGLRIGLLSGCALLRTNGLGLVLGLSIFLRYSDAGAVSALGKIVLTAAIVSTVLGEVAGTLGVRALIRRMPPERLHEGMPA